MGQIQHIKEEQMYRKIEDFLKQQGYQILGKKERFQIEDIGQKYFELDVIGYKDNTVWMIECKRYCTIEQFSFALGQLACYKWIFQKKPDLLGQRIKPKTGKDIKNFKCSIALLEMGKYRLEKGLLETFKDILSCYGLKCGLFKINEKTREVTEEIPAEILPVQNA
jgi:hypothetical protein